MTVLFPSSMVATLNMPLDGKTNVLTIADRNAIPPSQRYKGMMVMVQNPIMVRAQLFYLPTDDLTNEGWEEIVVGGAATTILVPNWTAGQNYVVFQIIVHGGLLYRATDAHVASDDFEADSEDYWEVIGGTADIKEYVHEQNTPREQWMIEHNFGVSNRALNVFIVDEEGDQIIGQVDVGLSTDDLLVYSFSIALSGKAYVR